MFFRIDFMRKLIIPILFLFLFALSCRYKDGPDISLRLPETRIKGYYDVTSFTVNDIESYSIYNDSCGCDLYIGLGSSKLTTSDLVLTACTKGDDTWGTFLFSKNHKKLFINYDSTDLKGYGPMGSKKYSEWDIYKLTNKELWIKTNFNNKDYFVKLKKKKV